jgi:hypothetical protein
MERNAMTHRQPPLSVTIIGWALVVFGTIGFLTLPIMLTPQMMELSQRLTGLPSATQVSLSLFLAALQLACGVGLLLRKNLARLSYLVFLPLATVVGFVLSGFKPSMLGGLLTYAVVLYFLTRPSVRVYFVMPSVELQSACVPESRPLAMSGGQIVRRVASVPLLLIGQAFRMTFAVSWLPFFTTVFSALFGTVFMLSFAALAIVPGLHLWGWKDRDLVWGVLLIVTGCESAIVGASLGLVLLTPEISEILAQAADPKVGGKMVWSAVVGACLLLPSGVVLFRRAMRRRRRGTATAPATPV